MPTVVALLTKAHQNLGKKAGLEALIAAWQASPAIALLELVERYEAAHPVKAFEGDFRAQAIGATAAERGALLGALVGPKSADTLARLEAIAQWAPDPRTSRALERLLREVPYTSDGTRPVWSMVFELVAKLKDPRFVALAPELKAGWKFRENHRKWMGGALDHAIARLPEAVPVLSAAEAKCARAIAADLKPPPKPSRHQDEEGLLADIYANPADDGPRLVYADWLQERGDPRGEFIALQCAKTPDPKREAALLKAHGAKWLGPLAPVVLKGVGFRRGFPAVVTARFKHQQDAEAHGGAKAWATVEELAFSEGTPGEGQQRWTQFLPPALRPRVLHTRAEGVAQLLAAKAPWTGLHELEVMVHDVELQRRLTASGLFPDVRRLTLLMHGDPGLFAKGWVGKVPELTLTRFAPPTLTAWLAALGPTQVQRLTFAPAWACAITLTRGEDGQLSVGRLDSVGRPGAAEYLGEALPDGWLTALEVENPNDAGAVKTLRKAKVRAGGAAAPAIASTLAAPQFVHAVAFAGDRLRVVDRGRLLECDSAGKPEREEKLNDVGAAAFTRDGRQLAYGAWKKCELRDADSGARLAAFEIPSKAKLFSFDVAGKRVLALGEGSATVHAVPSGQTVRKLGFGTFPNRPTAAALSPDGETIAVGLYTNDVAVYPPGAKRAARKLKHGSYLNQVLFLSNDRVVTSCRDKHVRIFDLTRDSDDPIVDEVIAESPVLALSPDAKVLVACASTMTWFLDPETLVERGTAKQVLSAPAFSRDGKRLAGHAKSGLVVIAVP